MDLLTTTERLPGPGETILGTKFSTIPGGKGANQAIAAARAGGDVTFIGSVGSDTFALELRRALAEADVDARYLREVDGPSGIATITVDAGGQNSIVVVPGANSTVVDLTPPELAVVAGADVLLCQLEIPLGTVVAAAAHGAANDTMVILNPSPAQPLPGACWRRWMYSSSTRPNMRSWGRRRVRRPPRRDHARRLRRRLRGL